MAATLDAWSAIAVMKDRAARAGISVEVVPFRESVPSAGTGAGAALARPGTLTLTGPGAADRVAVDRQSATC